MPPHSDFTTGFRQALTQGSVPQGTCPDLPKEAATRFAVYRNNVAHSLGQALLRRYPVVQRLVGDPFFAAMAQEFIATYPPRSPVLQEWGADFADFLAAFPPVATLPYLPDVARLEWTRGLAYHAADASPIEPETLPIRDLLHLHPSVSMLRLEHPAVSIWQANQPDRDGHVSARGSEIALIWRRTDFSVATQAVTPEDADFIAALLAGQSLAQAAALVNDPVPMLSLLLRETLICEKEHIQ